MKHTEKMVLWFRTKGGKATLREILTSGESWSYEFRARATDLRREGYVITCERAKSPSDNLYQVFEPEESGQLRLA